MCRKNLVSVIIPTYSRNETLVRALESVINQTYQNIEILVIDDNSPESEWRVKTEEIMERYVGDKRVRYLKNKRNLGGAGARNEGIKAARGEYLAFLDDDDYYYPNKIEKQLNLFLSSINEKLALVYCFAELIDKDGEIQYIYKENYRGNCLYEAIRYDCIAATSRWMVRKSCLESVGGFSIVPSKQDSTVILKLLEQGYEIDCVEEVLSQYGNSSSERISMGNLKNLEGQKLFIQKCRKNYDKFNFEQILSIEFIFAYKLFWLSDNNGLISERNRQFRRMLKCNIKETLIMVGKYFYHKLRGRVGGKK